MALAADLWVMAGGLIALALLTMATLMAIRIIRDYRTALRRKALSGCRRVLLGLIAGQVDGRRDLVRLARRGDLMADTLLEIAGLIRGADRDLLLTGIKAAGGFEPLARGAKRGGRRRRLIGLEAIATFPLVDCEPVLRNSLRDLDPEIRLAGVSGLIEAGAAISPAQLIHAAREGRLPVSLRFMGLLKRLIGLHPDAAVGVLGKSDLPLAYQLMLADGLGECGTYSAIPILVEKSQASSPELRAVAIIALGRLRHPGAEITVLRAMADTDWRVRRAAVEAVGLINPEGHVAALSERLADPVWIVRTQAARTLARGAAESQAALRYVSRFDPEGRTRELAASVLGQGLAA